MVQSLAKSLVTRTSSPYSFCLGVTLTCLMCMSYCAAWYKNFAWLCAWIGERREGGRCISPLASQCSSGECLLGMLFWGGCGGVDGSLVRHSFVGVVEAWVVQFNECSGSTADSNVLYYYEYREYPISKAEEDFLFRILEHSPVIK